MMNALDLSRHINEIIIQEFPHYSPQEIQEKCADFLNKYENLENKSLFDKYYQLFFELRLALMNEQCLNYDEQVIGEIRKVHPKFMPHFDDYKKSLESSKHFFEGFHQNDNVECNPLVFKSDLYPKAYNNYQISTPIKNLLAPVFNYCSDKQVGNIKYRLIYLFTFCKLNIELPNGKEYLIKTDYMTSSVILALAENNLSFTQIISLLNIPVNYLKQIIKKLNGMKLIKVIKCETNKIDDGEFSINPKFTNDKKEIIIIIDPIKEMLGKTALAFKDYERKEALKCGVIRELKQKKSLQLDELVRNIVAKFHDKFDVTSKEIEETLASLDGQYVKKKMIDEKVIYTYLA